MRIAVTDACIFIDLIELDLISEFFCLKLELHTTVEVMNELYSSQKQVLEAYQKVGKLSVHNLDEVDFPKIDTLAFPRGLSPEDRSVLYIALNLENGTVISSDKLVRKCAQNLDLDCHGLLWVFDLLVGQKICSKPIALGYLKKLIAMNTMYAGPKMRKEIDEMIKGWG
ncbi:MAG: PIN domain-containing protein [Cyclobacteriaceae bacterium]